MISNPTPRGHGDLEPGPWRAERSNVIRATQRSTHPPRARSASKPERSRCHVAGSLPPVARLQVGAAPKAAPTRQDDEQSQTGFESVFLTWEDGPALPADLPICELAWTYIIG
jgi:hypothetical protein